jgi:hypothetical protein
VSQIPVVPDALELERLQSIRAAVITIAAGATIAATVNPDETPAVANFDR